VTVRGGKATEMERERERERERESKIGESGREGRRERNNRAI
jgi:hypothetical protein